LRAEDEGRQGHIRHRRRCLGVDIAKLKPKPFDGRKLVAPLYSPRGV
jgi:hypothetical protein